MRGRGKLRIWPAYFDIRYTRNQGRRVPRTKAIRDPKVEDIEKAAKKLNLKPVLMPGAAYSKQPWRRTGVVLVDKKAPKEKIIEMIVEELHNV